VKQALADGKTTALFYTGGTEQRGPQNVNSTTIGMVAVADFRATAGRGPRPMIRSGLRATSSAAKAGRRS